MPTAVHRPMLTSPREVAVGAEHRIAGDAVARGALAVEHADHGRVPSLFDGVDHLTPLRGAADDDDAAHQAAPRKGSIVAWPGAEMPSPRSTLRTVIQRIRRSRRI